MSLTDREHAVLAERIVPLIDRVNRGPLSEEARLAAIGRMVDGVLTDLRDPLYDSQRSKIAPSILPKHDNTTIDHMARWQGVLAKADLPLPVAAELMDNLERNELFQQREDRRVA